MSVLGWLPRKLGRIVADQVYDRMAPPLGDLERRLKAAMPPVASPAPDAQQLALPPPTTGTALLFDYPTSAENRPRWTRGKGGHAGLRAIIERDRALWSASLQRLAARGAETAKLAEGAIHETLEEGDPRPRWRNAMMAGLDATAFTVFVDSRTRQVIEIGSGNSTKFLRHFVEALGLETKIVSIDPFPRAECDALCDTAIRKPLESVDLALFDRLETGDVVFFDGSHRCFMNSDVTAFFLDVLPRIPTGVAVGVHDIFLPDDYPEEWAERYYSEQYVLGAYLLGAAERLRVTLPAYWASVNREALGLDAIADAFGCPRDRFDGCSFWLEKVD
jgi:hypothetical protein